MDEDYPELAKMRAAKPDSQIIGQFLEWLDGQKLTICTFDEARYGGEYVPDNVGIERRLATYFEIDLRKVATEQEALLEDFRRRVA